MEPVLVYGDYLLASAQDGIRNGWGVLVEDGKVASVGPVGELEAKRPAAREIAAPGALVAPGFVNTHMHMYGILSRGIPVHAAPSGFYSFLEEFWWPYVEDRLDHETLRAAVRAACYEMIDSGVTCFADVLEAPNALPGCLDVEAEEVENTGLRGFLSFEATERSGPDRAGMGLQENARFASSRSGGSGVRGMMCIHTTFTCSRAFLARARDISREIGCGMHIHMSESSYEPEWCERKYGKRPAALYDEMGFLGPDLVASQCVKVSPEEIALLANGGVKVSHMPLSNCEVGGGVSPVPDMLAAGVSAGLGTDGYVNNFFEVMRGAFLIHKAYREDPRVMPAKTVYDMATRLGGVVVAGASRRAELAGLGTLAPGAPADLITIQMDLSTPVTAGNVFEQVVLHRNPKDVRDVMVGGQLVKSSGAVLTLDRETVLQGTRRAASRLWGV
ncbi:MAG: amidohydrolase family protein [Firmicutes bacterium]|nr:amidohydrolase family protein [Bacillota bacterium]